MVVVTCGWVVQHVEDLADETPSFTPMVRADARTEPTELLAQKNSVLSVSFFISTIHQVNQVLCLDKSLTQLRLVTIARSKQGHIHTTWRTTISMKLFIYYICQDPIVSPCSHLFLALSLLEVGSDAGTGLKRSLQLLQLLRKLRLYTKCQQSTT